MPKYAIEIDNKTNSPLLWAPTSAKLRGRWDWSRAASVGISESARPFVSQFPFIPGVYVVIDTDARKAKIIDPLVESKEGRQQWAEFSEMEKRHGHPLGGPWKLQDAPIETDLDDDRLKDWMWAMHRAVAAGHARMLDQSPRLPSESEIKAMAGKRRADPNLTQPLKDFDYFTDEVKAAGGDGASVMSGAPGNVEDAGDKAAGPRQRGPKQRAMVTEQAGDQPASSTEGDG